MNGAWIRTQDGSILLLVGVTHPIEESQSSWKLVGHCMDGECRIVAQYVTEEAAEQALELFIGHLNRLLLGKTDSAVFVFPD